MKIVNNNNKMTAAMLDQRRVDIGVGYRCYRVSLPHSETSPAHLDIQPLHVYLTRCPLECIYGYQYRNKSINFDQTILMRI